MTLDDATVWLAYAVRRRFLQSRGFRGWYDPHRPVLTFLRFLEMRKTDDRPDHINTGKWNSGAEVLHALAVAVPTDTEYPV